jgi:hypothetical protein
MQTVIATIAFFGLIMAAMAVGVIFTGRTLRGSCGGTGKDCSCSEEDRQGCPKAKPA